MNDPVKNEKIAALEELISTLNADTIEFEDESDNINCVVFGWLAEQETAVYHWDDFEESWRLIAVDRTIGLPSGDDPKDVNLPAIFYGNEYIILCAEGKWVH